MALSQIDDGCADRTRISKLQDNNGERVAEMSLQSRLNVGGRSLLLGETFHPSYSLTDLTLNPHHYSPNYRNAPSHSLLFDAKDPDWVNRRGRVDPIVHVASHVEKPTTSYNVKSTLSPRANSHAESSNSPHTCFTLLKHSMNFLPLAEGHGPPHPKSPAENEWSSFINSDDEGSNVQRPDSLTVLQSLTSSALDPFPIKHADESPSFLGSNPQIDAAKFPSFPFSYWSDPNLFVSRHHRNSAIGGRRSSANAPYPLNRSTRATATLEAGTSAPSSGKHLEVPSFSEHFREKSPNPPVHTPQLTHSPHSPNSPAFVSPYLSPLPTFEPMTAFPSQGCSSGPTISTEPDERISHRLGAGMTSGQPPGTESSLAVSFRSPSSDVPIPLISPELLHMPVREDTDTFLRLSFLDPANLWRRTILNRILSSSFLRDNEMEPMDKGPSDPITRGHGKKGKSIYAVFVEEASKGEWKCLFGSPIMPCPNNAVFKRFERAVEHVRSHLNHRPFKCTGECDIGPSCKRRFYAQQYLRDHLNRKGKTQCTICLRSVLVQNLGRHQNRHSTGKA
ncbi:hypothetical protein FRB91_008620 [Serendipita sp. 411]|nr:hypothetical protein FRC18_004353 [Serendipita sp. 400]KAG8850995.1 hypothetical protein FRB91_008620 [Serendipita sp. 411]